MRGGENGAVCESSVCLQIKAWSALCLQGNRDDGDCYPDREGCRRKSDTKAGRGRPRSDSISGNQKTHCTLLFEHNISKLNKTLRVMLHQEVLQTLSMSLSPKGQLEACMREAEIQHQLRRIIIYTSNP